METGVITVGDWYLYIDVHISGQTCVGTCSGEWTLLKSELPAGLRVFPVKAWRSVCFCHQHLWWPVAAVRPEQGTGKSIWPWKGLCVLLLWCVMQYVSPGTAPLSQRALRALGWGHWDLPSIICLTVLQRSGLISLPLGKTPVGVGAAVTSGVGGIALWVPSWWHNLVQPCGIQETHSAAFRESTLRCYSLGLALLWQPCIHKHVSKLPHAWNLNTKLSCKDLLLVSNILSAVLPAFLSSD